MTNEKAVQITPGQPFTEPQINLISRTIAKGATRDELSLFLNVAKKTGLDVWTKQVYFIKRKVWNGDKKAYDEVGNIQTGIDGYRVVAERSGQLAGSDDAVFDDETAPHPNKATVTVHRLVGGVARPFTASARWSEYAPIHPKTGEIMGQWKKMPFLMLAKCAEALALRKAFPNDLSGLYTEEEMGQAAVEGVVIDAPTKEDKKEAKVSKMKELMTEEPVEAKVVDPSPEIPTSAVCPVCKNTFSDPDMPTGDVKAISMVGMCNACSEK